MTLISDGLLERLGRMKALIPYSSVREVRIAPSRRRRALKCLAVLTDDDPFGPRWHRFDLGYDAPVGQIVTAFESKGFSVPNGECEEATDPPSGGETKDG